jgi:O-antigen/teichoic acid export membrane protein/membrane protease YdiL (CAAX protease family)
MMRRLPNAIRAGNRSLLVNSGFLIANTFAGSLFGFLFWLVAARNYTQAQVGMGAAYISAVTFLATLGEMGLGTAVIRFAPTLGDKRTTFINSAFMGAAIGTLVAGGLFALGIPLWSPEMQELVGSGLYLALFLGTALAFGQAQLVDKLFISFQAAHLTFARNIAANVTRLLFVIVVGHAFGAIGLLLAIGVSALLTFALALCALVPLAIPGYRVQPAFDRSILRDKISYTLSNHLASLLWNAPAFIYPLITLSMLGSEASAQFYIHWMIANLLFIVPTAISTSAFARAANQAAAGDRALWRAMRGTLVILAPITAIGALAAPFVLRVFGKDYLADEQALLLYLLASVFPYTVNTFTIVYHRVHQHTRSVICLAVPISALCLALSSGLSSVYGLTGIGGGWLAAQSVGMLIALWSYQSSPGVRPRGTRTDEPTPSNPNAPHRQIEHWFSVSWPIARRDSITHLGSRLSVLMKRKTMIATASSQHAKLTLWLLWGYLLLISAAEIITAAVHPQIGLILHALLLIGLTLFGASGQLTAGRRLALALTLAPLIRLLSLSLPLVRFPQATWYPIVAIPLLIAAWIVIRLLGVSRRDLGLRAGNLPLQLMLVGGGLGLGAAEYAILRPAPLIADYSWGALVLPALSLVIFTGFTEELIFRGLLQAVATPVLTRWTMIYVALLFAALHIGYLSVSDVAFVFAVGVLFGEIVRRGGSILGVTLAHGLTNVTLFLIMPYVAAHPSSIVAAGAPWAIWGGTAIALIAVNIILLRGVALRRPVQPTEPATAQLRDLRRSQGLTYTDLAQQTGLPVRLLAEIEHGLRLPQNEQLEMIAQALGLRSPASAVANAL